MNAKETFPSDHPLALGTPGRYSRACANQTLAEADLVFFVGSHTGGQVTNEWRLPRARHAGYPARYKCRRAGPVFPGRSRYPRRRGGRSAASHRPDGRTRRSGERGHAAGGRTRVRQLVDAWREGISALAASDKLPMRPERLCADLTRLLPKDAVLVSDTGHAGIWTGTMIDFTSPDQSYIRCAGSLGWSAARRNRRQVRRTGAARYLFHRRRRDVVPHHRAGYGGAQRRPYRHHRQQQRVAKPGTGAQRAQLRRTHSGVRSAMDADRRRLRRNRRNDGLPGINGRTTRPISKARSTGRSPPTVPPS